SSRLLICWLKVRFLPGSPLSFDSSNKLLNTGSMVRSLRGPSELLLQKVRHLEPDEAGQRRMTDRHARAEHGPTDDVERVVVEAEARVEGVRHTRVCDPAVRVDHRLDLDVALDPGAARVVRVRRFDVRRLAIRRGNTGAGVVRARPELALRHDL